MLTFTQVDTATMEKAKPIARAKDNNGRPDHGLASLIFRIDDRPDMAALERAALATDSFAIGHKSDEAGASADPDRVKWVELVSGGMTFDLHGLAPGDTLPLPEIAHALGMTTDFAGGGYGALTIAPGPHLASGTPMVPVLRSLAQLVARLSKLPGLQGIVWHASRTCCEPEYFHKSIMHWIDGGPFPGLGLTALNPTPDGGLASEGLSLWTRQELQLDPAVATDKAEGAKIALRLLHWLVENGQLSQSQLLTGPAGEQLMLNPSENLSIVKVLTPQQ